jgi:hypothetical protein
VPRAWALTPTDWRMRYWICDISSKPLESRFEIDFDEPPAEGSVIAPGHMVYRVTAIVRVASETSPGVIEVVRVTDSPGLQATSARLLARARDRGNGALLEAVGLEVSPAASAAAARCRNNRQAAHGCSTLRPSADLPSARTACSAKSAEAYRVRTNVTAGLRDDGTRTSLPRPLSTALTAPSASSAEA